VLFRCGLPLDLFSSPRTLILPNAQIRPFVDLPDLLNERAVITRKRTLAEGVGCARLRKEPLERRQVRR
jgi:hypothetical protein